MIKQLLSDRLSERPKLLRSGPKRGF